MTCFRRPGDPPLNWKHYWPRLERISASFGCDVSVKYCPGSIEYVRGFDIITEWSDDWNIWTENVLNPNSPAHIYNVGQNGGNLSGFLQIEENIWSVSPFRNSLISDSFRYIMMTSSNGNIFRATGHFHTECQINPVNQPLYARQATGVL